MKFRSAIFLGCVLAISSPNLVLAADHDPCAGDNLKGWAKKDYAADYCLTKGNNTAPSVTITSPSDQSNFTNDQVVNLLATANDNEDGDLSSTVLWNSSIDGAISATTILSAGTHTVTASVSDSGSLSATDSIVVNVTEAPQNTAPSLSIVSPTSGSVVEAGTAINLQASALDEEDGDISNHVYWYSSINGEIDNITTLTVGEHTISATVYDSEGLIAEDTIMVSVVEASNTNPTVTITSPTSQSEFSNDQVISLQASANDSEDGDLSGSVVWNSSLDGSIPANTLLTAGTHTITAAVTDSGDLTAMDSITIHITETAQNTAPSLTIDSPASGSVVEEGTALMLAASAYDAEDGDLSSSVTWYSSIDGEVGNLTTLSVGDHTLYASVQDSSGQVAEDQVSLSVVSQTVDPVVTHSVTISWNPPTERADGSQLSTDELSGYRINWTNTTTGTRGSVDVSGGLSTYYDVTNLASGSYQFTLNTVDTNGLVSMNSQEMAIDLY